MIEIAGFCHNNISYYPWQIDKITDNMPTHVALSGGSSIMLGAGSKHMTDTDAYFITNNINYEYYLVNLSCEKYTAIFFFFDYFTTNNYITKYIKEVLS